MENKCSLEMCNKTASQLKDVNKITENLLITQEGILNSVKDLKDSKCSADTCERFETEMAGKCDQSQCINLESRIDDVEEQFCSKGKCETLEIHLDAKCEQSQCLDLDSRIHEVQEQFCTKDKCLLFRCVTPYY